MALTSIAASWRSQNMATRLLRLWLGGTWFYGGWQKASDNTFLNKASTNYIGAQLAGLAQHSPLKFALRHMVEHASLIGVSVMLSEFAIGIAVLTGIALQLAIVGGALVSLILWLSVTWTVYPYFLGSDSAYLVMWIALLFLVRQQNVGRGKRAGVIPDLTDRREFVRIVGVGTTAIIAALAGSRFQKPGPKSKAGAIIVKLASFPVGSNMQFTAPDGNPAFLFRTNAGVFAYSATCTHQGCTLGYSVLEHTLNCPCHGGKYDPANGGKVIAGPPPTPLPKYKVAIKGDSIVTV
jgi:thiosulfate dehydrogenase [quinone] large subunit